MDDRVIGRLPAVAAAERFQEGNNILRSYWWHVFLCKLLQQESSLPISSVNSGSCKTDHIVESTQVFTASILQKQRDDLVMALDAASMERSVSFLSSDGDVTERGGNENLVLVMNIGSVS